MFEVKLLRPFDGVDADFVEGGEDRLTEGAGAQFVRRFAIGGIDEGHVENRHGRVEAREEGRRRDGALDHAELHALVHLARLAELAGGKQFEHDIAVGALTHEFGNDFEALMAGLFGALEMADPGRVFLRCGAAGKAERHGQRQCTDGGL